MTDADQNPSTGARQSNYVDLAADIVSAYVAKNAVPISELPSLIASVHSALNQDWQQQNGTAAREAGTGCVDQEVDHSGLHHLSG